MRDEYTVHLDELVKSTSEMCLLAVGQLERATHALLQVDLVAAEEVLSNGERSDEYAALNEERGFGLLALQSPVARDLRQVVSCIQLVQDISRMSALASHVAKIARRKHPEPALPESVNGYFAEMGRVAASLGRSAAELLISKDPKAAAVLSQEDDAMDDLRRHLFTLLTVREWPFGVAAAVDVALLGRYYERFGDHAVEISRKVIFLATGQTPEEYEVANADELYTKQKNKLNEMLEHDDEVEASSL